jgi:hypothetical protein
MAVADHFPGLDGHSCVTIGDYAVIYGGKLAPRQMNAQVFALDLTTNGVRRLRCSGGAPSGRAFHSAVVWGWKMYVFGGLLAVGVEDVHYNAYNYIANLDSLDEQTLSRAGPERRREPNKLPRVTQEKREGTSLHVLDVEGEPCWHQPLTTGTLPPTRANHSAVVYRSAMYVVGGYSVHTTARATDEEVKACHLVYALDLQTHLWYVVETPQAPAPHRWGSSAVLSGGVWMFFGGVDPVDGADDNSVYGWHMDLCEWRWLPVGADAPPRRTLHAAVRWGAHMLVFGGVGGCGSLPFNDVFALDMLTGKWSEVGTTGTPPAPRSGHACAVVGEEMYVVGGLDHAFHRSARAWALNLRSFAWRTVATNFSPQDLTNLRGLTAPALNTLPRGPPRLKVTVVPYAHSVGTSAYEAGRIETDYGGAPIPYMAIGSPGTRQLAMGTTRVPEVSSQQDETMQFLRTDIARTKSVLSSMIDSATARAERDQDDYDPDDKEPVTFRDGASARKNKATRADEATDHLHSEVDARIQRLQDMAATAKTEARSSVQGYWRHEIDRLSSENERWRMAVQREHALMQDAERLYATPTESQKATRQLIHSGAPPPRLRQGQPSTGAAYFPHSTAVPEAPLNRVHDATDPHYEPLKFAPAGKKFVSPSLVKLGLASQLGRGMGQSTPSGHR